MALHQAFLDDFTLLMRSCHHPTEEQNSRALRNRRFGRRNEIYARVTSCAIVFHLTPVGSLQWCWCCVSHSSLLPSLPPPPTPPPRHCRSAFPFTLQEDGLRERGREQSRRERHLCRFQDCLCVQDKAVVMDAGHGDPEAHGSLGMALNPAWHKYPSLEKPSCLLLGFMKRRVKLLGRTSVRFTFDSVSYGNEGIGRFHS